MTVEIYKKDKITADALLGHISFGASLGYQVAQAGPVAVTVMAGIAHPWTQTLSQGWFPVAGIKVRF